MSFHVTLICPYINTTLFNFKAMGMGLIFKIGFMDPSEAQVKSFYEKQAAASK